MARDSSALTTSKDGFSVVAPTKIKSPDSTCGRKASCWLLLKRCTSSTNTTVGRCVAASVCLAASTASRMSFTPPKTADIAIKGRSKAFAINRAIVVLPTPGGPQRIMECGRRFSNATRSGAPGPKSFFWPMTSSKVCGRMRSAKGFSIGSAAECFPAAPRSCLAITGGDSVVPKRDSSVMASG